MVCVKYHLVKVISYIHICIIVNFAFTCMYSHALCQSAVIHATAYLSALCSFLVATYLQSMIHNRSLSILKVIDGEEEINATVEDCSYEVCT